MFRGLCVALAALVALAFLPPPATAQAPGSPVIIGTLCNFDAVNNTGVAVNDFRIVIRHVPRTALLNVFVNPTFGPPQVIPIRGGFEVYYPPLPGSFVPPGGIAHFGVHLRAGFRPRIEMYWTLNGKRVPGRWGPGRPWQDWRWRGRRAIDIIRNWGIGDNDGFWVRRRVNRVPAPVQLEELTVESPLWQNAQVVDDAPVFVPPGGELLYDDPFFEMEEPPSVAAPQSFILGYEVWVDDPTGLRRFVGTSINAITAALNEATIRETLSNFDVVNRTGRFVNDFHIRIAGLQPHQVLGMFMNPRFGPPIVIPLGSGVDIVYPPMGIPIAPGEVMHFGVVLLGNPNPDALAIQMFWTIDGQPLPPGPFPWDPNRPWQRWSPGPPPRRVIDILTNNNPEWMREFLVQRRVFRMPGPIQLEMLTRESPLWMEAMQIDPEPVPLAPMQELWFVDSFFDVFLDADVTGLMLGYESFDRMGDGATQNEVGTTLNAVNVSPPPFPFQEFRARVNLEDYGGKPDAWTAHLEIRSASSPAPFVADLPIEPDGTIKTQLPDLTEDFYDFRVKVGHWLAESFFDVWLDSSGIDCLEYSLANGDIDDDNAVTVFDYNLLSDAFDSAPGDPNWNPMADLDGDESVTVFDYNILSNNFDMVGDD